LNEKKNWSKYVIGYMKSEYTSSGSTTCRGGEPAARN
jgi:hypothetical protein